MAFLNENQLNEMGFGSIGKNVLIKGSSYLFGSVVEDDVTIEHSVLIKKKIKAENDATGKIKPVRFYIPETEGKDLLSDI